LITENRLRTLARINKVTTGLMEKDYVFRKINRTSSSHPSPTRFKTQHCHNIFKSFLENKYNSESSPLFEFSILSVSSTGKLGKRPLLLSP